MVDGATDGIAADLTLDAIVDIEAIRSVAESVHALTGHAISVVDLDDNFLVRVGWTEACKGFHRASAATCELCRESDVEMSRGVPRGETRSYRCRNGLWHAVTPVFVGDRHLANVFTSQFFFDDSEIDLAEFEARAVKYGFDREEYLAAIAAVPRYSHETIDAMMRLLALQAEQLAALGLAHLQMAETMNAHNRALQARVDSETRFAALVAAAPLPIAVSSADGTIDHFNDEFTRVFGYTVDDVPTLDDWYRRAYQDGAMRASAIARWDSAMNSVASGDGRVSGAQYTITCKNGDLRSVIVSGAVSGDRVIALFDDVTEREKAADALRQSEAKFATAFRTSPDAVNLNRLTDGMYIEINEGFTNLTGYTAEDVAGKTSVDIKIWADPADRELLVKGLRERGVVDNLEARFRRKDGSTTTALMSARIMEVDGERCILSMTRDISDRKHAELLLSESQRIARVGHYEWDIVADRWNASEVLADIFGIDETYVCDLNGFLNIVHPEDRAGVTRYVAEHVVRQRKPFDREYRIVRVSDGAERWVHGLGTVTCDETGAPLSLFGIIQDITERKSSDAEVRHSREALERMVYDVSETMGRVVEARDPYTQGHQQRVADLSTKIAARMGMSSDKVDEVRMAGLLHDVGKLRTPTEILTKPGRLSPVEFALVKDHPTQAHEILKGIAFPWAVADIALQHHERMDGSGYPDGLTGDEILVAARILAVADVVEAMASHRPYRAALGEDAAIAEIVSHPDWYDGDVVAACIGLHEDGELGL